MDKVAHVLTEAAKGHDGTHLCHGGCGNPCAPSLWGCSRCWFRLPRNLRARIWRTYRPGQEIDKNSSREYLLAAMAVEQWVKENPL